MAIQRPQKHDFSTIVDDLEGLFLRFLGLTDGLALVLALWSLATHCFDIFDAFPYLAITSPTKRCGKTRACELISFVCFAPIPTVNISPAALFRLVANEKKTLLIDEAESLRSTKDEKAATLREVLNSGYRKGSKVLRCKRRAKTSGQGIEDAYEIEEFDVYSPKAIIAIGQLPDTLSDRCIEIRMERRRGKVPLERFRYARVRSEMRPLQSSANLWARQNAKPVTDYYDENELSFLQDREEELFLPLFSVCNVAAPHRLSDLESVAICLTSAKSAAEPADHGLQLLNACRELFSGEDRLSTVRILQELTAANDKPWAEWNHGRGLNAHGLSRLLRQFQIQPQNIRIDGQVVKGYLRQNFQEAWERYL